MAVGRDDDDDGNGKSVGNYINIKKKPDTNNKQYNKTNLFNILFFFFCSDSLFWLVFVYCVCGDRKRKDLTTQQEILLGKEKNGNVFVAFFYFFFASHMWYTKRMVGRTKKICLSVFFFFILFFLWNFHTLLYCHNIELYGIVQEVGCAIIRIKERKKRRLYLNRIGKIW